MESDWIDALSDDLFEEELEKPEELETREELEKPESCCFEDVSLSLSRSRFVKYADMIDRIVDFLLANFTSSDPMLFHILRQFRRRKDHVIDLENVMERCDSCSELFEHLAGMWMKDYRVGLELCKNSDSYFNEKRREMMVQVESLRSITQVRNCEMNAALNILFNEMIVLLGKLSRESITTINQRLVEFFRTFMRFFKYEAQGIDLGFSTMRLL